MAIMYAGTDPATGAPIYVDDVTGETVTLGAGLYQAANDPAPPPANLTGTTAGSLSAAGPVAPANYPDPPPPVDGADPSVMPYQINTPGEPVLPSGDTLPAMMNPTPSGAIAIKDGAAFPTIGDVSVPGPAPIPDAPPPVDPSLAADGGSEGFYGSGRSSRGRSYGGGSYGSDSSSSGGSSFVDDSDGLDNLPAYADGSRHPAQTGESLVPGGEFNDGSSSADYRRRSMGRGHYYDQRGEVPLRSPVRAYAPGIVYEDNPRRDAARERSWQFRQLGMNRVDQALADQQMGGMGGGLAGGTGTAMGGAPSPTLGGPGGTAMGDTGTARLRGWAERQGYTGSGLQSMLSTKPEALLLDVFPGMESSDATFGQLRGLPMNELVMLANGGRRNWTGAPDQQANTLAEMFREVATKPRWFDFHSMVKNLTKAPATSPLGQLTSAGASPEQNEYYYDTYFNALADATMSDDVALAYKQRVEDLQTDYASQAAKRGPRRPMPSMATYVGRHLMR